MMYLDYKNILVDKKDLKKIFDLIKLIIEIEMVILYISI